MEQERHVTARVDPQAVAAAVRQLGWRVYAANQPADQLSLEQAVLAYRDQYLVERDMGRLKGQPLSLTPMDLERDDHATGLIRLLSMGLRVLTLLEFVVRRRLAVERTALARVVCGPTEAGDRPPYRRTSGGEFSGGHADHHPGGAVQTLSSHAALPRATSHSGAHELARGHLHETLY